MRNQCFRNLRELEIQLSLDATEEGLLALAGRSGQERDQGFHKHWENALYIHKVNRIGSVTERFRSILNSGFWFS